METTPEIQAPAPAPVAVEVPVQVQPPVQASTSFEDGGALENKAPSKWKAVDILILSLWIVLPIYGILYYRKAIQKLDEQPTVDEFDNMTGDIEEVKYNLQKALGKKYQKT
jgi:hypothetical protein